MTLHWRIVHSDPCDRLDHADTDTGLYVIDGAIHTFRASHRIAGAAGEELIGTYNTMLAARQACETHHDTGETA